MDPCIILCYNFSSNIITEVFIFLVLTNLYSGINQVQLLIHGLVLKLWIRRMNIIRIIHWTTHSPQFLIIKLKFKAKMIAILMRMIGVVIKNKFLLQEFYWLAMINKNFRDPEIDWYLINLHITRMMILFLNVMDWVRIAV
jgi:hypothetical protein